MINQSEGPPPNVNVSVRGILLRNPSVVGVRIAKRDNAQKGGHPEDAALERLGESSIPQSDSDGGCSNLVVRNTFNDCLTVERLVWPDISAVLPINVDNLAIQLCSYPDRQQVDYILSLILHL